MAERLRGLVKDERQEDFEQFGVDAAAAAAWLAAEGVEDEDDEPTGPLEIWPENWPTLRAWLSLQTQWHLQDGMPQGLRYDAVDVVIRRLKLADEVFEQLIEMEHAALEAWDERQ